MSRSSKRKEIIWQADGTDVRRKKDYLTVEEPLEIRLKAGAETRSIAITMRTPGDDFELAAGFLYSEGVISEKDQVDHMRYCVDDSEDQHYNALIVSLKRPELPDMASLERHFFVNSACGICGKAALDAIETRQPPTLPSGPQVDLDIVYRLPGILAQTQSIFEQTGGLHAAALFNIQGHLIAAREDVGRHNALDKLIGWALLNKRLPLNEQIIVVSGRASFELLQKSLFAGSAIFCAVSAPSSLARDLAYRYGITLVGFLRENRCNIYTHPERIVT